MLPQRISPLQTGTLLAALPIELAVRIELEEGIPVLRASAAVQDRIEALLHKQEEAGLTREEVAELDRYEDIDAYLSHLNRIVRNQHLMGAVQAARP